MTKVLETHETIGGRCRNERILNAVLGIEPEPVTVGRDERYRVEERIGQGGMGQVFRARDTLLDRPVALKVVSQAYNSLSLRHRLLVEAQLLARVEHPHVLPIYDCEGSDFGELIVVTAHVEGDNLKAWGPSASAHELVDAYIAAGRGLAAAHERGVVHRDFKPSNVLVERDSGRIFVADFGLAQTRYTEGSDTSLELEAGGGLEQSGPGPTQPLTGTRGYLAPELFAGEPASPRSDQFAFCVSMWWSLVDQVETDTPDHLKLPFGTKLIAPRGVPARPAAVPRWLYRVLARGMATDPRDRYPSMDAVVGALVRGATRHVRFSAAGFALVFLIVALSHELTHDSSSPNCTQAASTMLAEVWGPTSQARISEALTSPGARTHDIRAEPFAQTVFADAAQAWLSASIGSCEAHARDPSSYRAVNHRECLAAQLDRFGETLAQLEQLGPRAVPTIDKLLAPLHGLDQRCAYPQPILDPDARRTLTAVEFSLAERETERGLELARNAIEAVQTHAEPCAPASEASAERGEAYYRLAQVHALREEPELVLEALANADVDANACNHDELLARSYVLRAQVEALELGDPTRASRSRRAGEARYAALGGPGIFAVEIHEARAAEALARANSGAAFDHYEAAIDHYEAAIDSLGSALAVQPQVAKLRANIGGVLQMQGQFDAAKAAYTEAVAIVSNALGADHPETRARRGQALVNRATMASEQGEIEPLRSVLRQLIEFDEPGLALQAHTILLNALYGEPDHTDEARAEALALAERLESATNLPLEARATAHTIVGQVLALDDDPRARTALRRALALWRQLPSPGPSRDVCQLVYVESSLRAGELELARQELLDLLERADASMLALVRDRANELATDLGLDGSG